MTAYSQFSGPPLSGMPTRLKNLPVVHHNVVQIECDGDEGCDGNNAETNAAYGQSIINPAAFAQQEKALRGTEASLAVVYHYEDCFSFARILRHNTLVFNSHFEGGNLLSAQRVTRGAQESNNGKSQSTFQEYDLQLHDDVSLHRTNCDHGHQWFYFR
jgi:hypothetical protein